MNVAERMKLVRMIEKMNENKLLKLFGRETWIPICNLSKNTACAFLKYDGASLIIVENGNNFFEENKSGKYWTYKGKN